jgi:hypothetical protein
MSTTDTVRALLGAAGLTLPEDELAAVAAGYPALRAELDAMFQLPVRREEEPELRVVLPSAVRTRRPPRRPAW